jgi:hypothetical protein
MEKTPSPPLTEAKKREIAHQVKLRLIRIDHEIRMQAIRRKSADFHEKLALERRTEERISNELLDLRFGTWRLNRRMWEYTSKKGEPFPQLDLSLAKKLTRRVLESIDRGQDPQVQAWRHHIAALCQELGVRPTYAVEYFGQGYAWASLKEIELPPINSAFTYGTGPHELGHTQHPCEKSHTRVTIEAGRTCCVRCELLAWRWAIDHAIRWDSDSHESLVCGLSSYRKYGTPAEQAEIDAMISPIGFRRAQLACVLKETK